MRWGEDYQILDSNDDQDALCPDCRYGRKTPAIELTTAELDELIELGTPHAREIYDKEGISRIRFYSNGGVPDAITEDPFEYPQTLLPLERFIDERVYPWSQFLNELEQILGINVEERIEQ